MSESNLHFGDSNVQVPCRVKASDLVFEVSKTLPNLDGVIAVTGNVMNVGLTLLECVILIIKRV